MGFSTISKQPVDKLELLKIISIICSRGNFKFGINEISNSEHERIEVYVEKQYNPEDEYPNYFLMDILPKSEQIDSFEKKLSEIKYEGTEFYMLTGTDQANYDHLIYDFSLEYLRLCPEHVITLIDNETFFSLQDLKKMESEGGYYKDWCFGVSRPE